MASLDAATVARLWARARGETWGLTAARFGEALAAAAAKGADLDALHLEDLALATACADGQDAAWEHFIRTYRPILYRSADAIDPSGGARELADALYGELFGLAERDGTRQSLFRYFHGRSRLDTWLRAVLAQRHVDRVRATRRTDALPDDDGPAPLAAPAAAPDPEHDASQRALAAALGTAIAALEPRERLRLRLYYAHDMTLAAIGRRFQEHEASVSRHLSRTRAAVRTAVERELRERHGLDDRTVAECLSRAQSDPGALDLAVVLGPEAPDDPGGKNPAVRRSNNGESHG